MKTNTTATSIPTIHLDGTDHAETVAAVRKACTEWGFFYVTGFNNTSNNCTVEDVLAQSKLFFDLPTNQKQAVSDPKLTRGYTALQEETLDPKNQTVGDTKEGFYISVNEIPTTDPRYNPAKLNGPNQWPSTQTCPDLQDPAQWKLVMKQYMNDVTALSRQIVQLLAESLDLPATYFDPFFAKEPLGALRLLHYSETTSQLDAGVYACGAHTDYGMITVLLTDEQPGLEIRHHNEWIAVPPLAHHWVVNLGDMLERWTNGKYRSTLHRVVNTNGRERYSIPFFFEPSFDTVVECLPSCCNATNPAKWPPITSGEHLLSKYAQTHADFGQEHDE